VPNFDATAQSELPALLDLLTADSVP
jgi:hypothetical protein